MNEEEFAKVAKSKKFNFALNVIESLTEELWYRVQFHMKADSPLVLFGRNINDQSYTHNVQELVAYLQQLYNSIFQQNNTKPHTTAVTTRTLVDLKFTLITEQLGLLILYQVWDRLGELFGWILDFRWLIYELGILFVKKTLITLFETGIGKLRNVFT